MNRTFKKCAAVLVGIALWLGMFGCTAKARGPVVVSAEALETYKVELYEAPSPCGYIGHADPTWEPVETQEVPVTAEPTEVPTPTPAPSEEVEVIESTTLDRTKPIYEVYKNGWFVEAATADVQWIIRDLSEQYGLPEKAIYGLICAESTFVPDLESFDGGCWGLAQINTFWITRANITHFTDDYRNRNLCDPYDNLLTLAEMMCYARDTYGLDFTQRADLVKYLYWHNTGKDPTRVTRWDYATRALGYADELVALQS